MHCFGGILADDQVGWPPFIYLVITLSSAAITVLYSDVLVDSTLL